jgi:hypothetical protein
VDILICKKIETYNCTCILGPPEQEDKCWDWICRTYKSTHRLSLEKKQINIYFLSLEKKTRSIFVFFKVHASHPL